MGWGRESPPDVADHWSMLVEVPRVSLRATLATPFHARCRRRSDELSHAAVEAENRKDECRTILATA